MLFVNFSEKGGLKFSKKVAIFRNKWHFFSGISLSKIDKNWQKNEQFSTKINKKLLKSARNTLDFPEKKCHLIWKIAIFFKNFSPPFSEKLVISTRSPKKDHVPN